MPPEDWLLLEGGAGANPDGVPSAHRFCATLGPPPPDSPLNEGVRLLFQVLAGLMPAGMCPAPSPVVCKHQAPNIVMGRLRAAISRADRAISIAAGRRPALKDKREGSRCSDGEADRRGRCGGKGASGRHRGAATAARRSAGAAGRQLTRIRRRARARRRGDPAQLVPLRPLRPGFPLPHSVHEPRLLPPSLNHLPPSLNPSSSLPPLTLSLPPSLPEPLSLPPSPNPSG